MKKTFKIFAVLLVMAIALLGFNITANAAETSNTQDGLTATITTEKDSYQANEDITVDSDVEKIEFSLSGFKTKTIDDFLLFDGNVYLEKSNVPNDAFEYNGHYYKIYNNCNTWEDALSYCENLGGHLATITSAEENDALFNYMKKSGYETAYFGFSDKDNEGNWKWVTGENVDYTNWSSGEPNNDGYGEENYAEFYYKYNDGTWNDGNFNNGTTNDRCNFICEWDN